jgi:uncharacterized membrane protein YgcG
MLGNTTFQSRENTSCCGKKSSLYHSEDSQHYSYKDLPKAMEYVNHLKSRQGPHKMAFNMHIGWLKALGAPTYYTCEQMVNAGCNEQNLMCESYGKSRGCSMSTIRAGRTPCAFSCTMSECQKCETKAKNGECTADDCIKDEFGQGGYGDYGGGGDGGSNFGGSDEVGDDSGGGRIQWSDVQISDLKTHLTQTFPNMIDLKNMDLHDVSVDEVTQCATNMISKIFQYHTIINDDDEIYPNVTKRINSILYICVKSLSKGKTGGGGTTGGGTTGDKSDGGGNILSNLSVLSIVGIFAACIIVLLGLFLLFMSTNKKP